MKQTTKNWIGAVALICASSAVTGAVVKSSVASSEANNPEPVFPQAAPSAAVAGGFDGAGIGGAASYSRATYHLDSFRDIL